MPATLRQCLIEDWNYQRSDGDFQQAYQEHCKRRQCECFPVRLDISEQSLKIAHQQLQSVGRISRSVATKSESVAIGRNERRL
jgi:hypothetical protein